MKYKVGDRVKIKSINWYNENKDMNGNIFCGCEQIFNHCTSRHCGQVLTIKHIDCLGWYEVEEEAVFIKDGMIEGLVEEETKPKIKFKVGDKITNGKTQLTILSITSNKYIVENNFGECGTLYFNTQDDWKLVEEESKPKDMGEVSDGYHTFNELYEYRLLYNASFFNELAKQNLYDVHKSKKHSDGEDCFGGSWFIVMAELPTGQVSNHYELKDWDLFKVPEKELANKWDGHTPQDVAKRMREFLTPKPKYPKTYEECAKVLLDRASIRNDLGYKGELLVTLQKLLVCRDAYWKIAGEEMGLGKPWELSIGTPIYYIYYNRTVGAIKNDYADDIQGNVILAFPTEEMRDAFYENFKELIEECKELL